MLRIAMCIMVPFIILFAGLSPAYLWAVPLFVGSIAIFLVFLAGDISEQRFVDNV